MQISSKISAFCAFIAVFSAFFYYVLRIGFEQSFVFPLFQILGVSLLLLFLPDTFGKFLQKNPQKYWFWNEALIPIFGLIFLSLLGFLSILSGLNISLPFVIGAYILFFIHLWAFLKKSKTSNLLLYGFITLFFSFWVIGIGWAKTPLKPTFIENFITAFEVDWATWYGGDTLFHLAMEQMIKSYFVPSTGLYGLPWMYYHYGMHWIFALLSAFLNVSVPDLHNIGYVVLFMPLFFRSFLSFIVALRYFTGQADEKRDTKFGYIFWLLFLCFFIQLFKDKYSGGQIGVSALISENFTISLTFLFAFFSACLFFYKNQSSTKTLFKGIFLFLFFPFMFLSLGFLKISTGFVAFGLFGYLFLRLQLFRFWLYGLSFLLMCLAFAFTYYSTIETLPFGLRTLYKEGGEFELFHFYKNPEFEPFTFFFFFFIWIYIFIIFLFIQQKINSFRAFKTAFKNKSTISAEILIVIALVGIFPSLFFVTIAHNMMYFLSTQLFVSIAFLLAYLPIFAGLTENRFAKLSNQSKRIFSFIASLAIFIALGMHVFWEVNLLLKTNIKTRIMIAGTMEERQKPDEKPNVSQIFENAQLFIHHINNSQNLLDSLQKNQLYKYVQKIRELDKKLLSQKSQTMLYIDFSTFQLPWKLYCHTTAFIAPAMSGLVMINGATAGCVQGSFAYGYEYYRDLHKDLKNINRTFSNDELCTFAKKQGFRKLLIYNLKSREFENFDCK